MDKFRSTRKNDLVTSPPSTAAPLSPVSALPSHPARIVPRVTYPQGKTPALFSHCEVGTASVASLLDLAEAGEEGIPIPPDNSDDSASLPTLSSDLSFSLAIHPTFSQLGLDYASGALSGSSARSLSFLAALILYFDTFVPPKNTPLVPFLTAYINLVKRFLNDCRTLPLPMTNILDICLWIVSRMRSTKLDDNQLSYHIQSQLQTYMGDLRQQHEDTVAATMKNIANGDFIATFGFSDAVLHSLLSAQRAGIMFKVIVFDSLPLREGKNMLYSLVEAGFECDYALITSLYSILPSVTKVIVGAHAVLNNGNVLARSGTALLSTAAHHFNKPVLVSCESFKFVNQVYLDSICHNQLGNPYQMTQHVPPSVAEMSSFSDYGNNAPDAITSTLPQPLWQSSAGEDGAASTKKSSKNATPAAAKTASPHPVSIQEKMASKLISVPPALAVDDWDTNPELASLTVLNLRYDLTPAPLINGIITNYDIVAPTSASVIAREEFKRSQLSIVSRHRF